MKINFVFPFNTLVIKLSVALCIVMFFDACNPTDDSTTAVTIEQLKSADYQKYVEQDVEIEGFLVYTVDNGAILLSDMNLMGINRAYDQSDYVRIDGVAFDAFLAGNEATLYGAKVSLTARVKESKNQVVLNMQDFLGDASVIEIAPVVAPKIITPRSGWTPPLAYNFCDSHPEACEITWQSSGDYYAILYSGGVNQENAHIRYWNDIKFMYKTLKKYGYTDDQIVVVYRNGNSDDPISFVPEVTVDYPASVTGLANAFDDLRSRMNANDQLFVFTTNHGGGYHQGNGSNNGGVDDDNADEIDMFQRDDVMYYYNESMSLLDDVFATQINSLSFGTLVVVMEPCFSGGFLRDLRGNNRILISAANEFEFSYSDFWGNYDEFVFHFTSALNGFEPRNLLGTPAVNADYNSDGKVSILEAFQYAKLKDRAAENPQYEDSGDGIGTSFPTETGVDGSFGASIFL